MLSEKELIILSELRKNSRKSVKEISNKTKIANSTVIDKLNNLKKKKIIKKHTSLVDFSLLGYPIKVNFLIKCKENLEKKILDNKHINSIYKIRGEFDFLIQGIFKDMNELANFSDELDKLNIEKKEEHHIVEDLKVEEFSFNNTLQ